MDPVDHPPSAWPTGPPLAGAPDAEPVGRPDAASGVSPTRASTRAETLTAVAGGLGVVAGALAAVAVFQPWVDTLVESQTGWANGTLDAKVALVLAAATVVLGLLLGVGRGTPAVRFALAACGAGLIAVSFVARASVDELDPLVQGEPGSGLTLLTLAGALALAAGLLPALARPDTPEPVGGSGAGTPEIPTSSSGGMGPASPPDPAPTPQEGAR